MHNSPTTSDSDLRSSCSDSSPTPLHLRTPTRFTRTFLSVPFVPLTVLFAYRLLPYLLPFASYLLPHLHHIRSSADLLYSASDTYISPLRSTMYLSSNISFIHTLPCTLLPTCAQLRPPPPLLSSVRTPSPILRRISSKSCKLRTQASYSGRYS